MKNDSNYERWVGTEWTDGLLCDAVLRGEGAGDSNVAQQLKPTTTYVTQNSHSLTRVACEHGCYTNKTWSLAGGMVE